MTPTGTPRVLVPLTGVVLGRLGASDAAIATYRQLQQDAAYRHPLSYDEIEPYDFTGIVLPGGHAPGMRQYLESATLQHKVRTFWAPDVVEDEVKTALGPRGRFIRGGPRKRPFVVEDGNLVTARWPGDAEQFAAAVTAKVLTGPAREADG